MNSSVNHDWQATPSQAVAIQRELAYQVSTRDEFKKIRLVAGVDIAAPDRQGIACGAIVVLNFPALTLIESQVVEQKVTFPYIAGLLSFREAPIIIEAYERLSNIPDLIMVDGQGVAHPRRLGLASHLGLILAKPTIGCAKSRLCGRHEEAGMEPGDAVNLMDGEEIIGTVLRTRKNVKPLFISIGHKISLQTAVTLVLNCCQGYRLPEPTRLAHLAAGNRTNQSPQRTIKKS